KTLLADHSHFLERAANALSKKIEVDAGESRRFAPAENEWCDGEVELINKTKLEQGAKEYRPTLTSDVLYFVIEAQLLQHPAEVHLRRFAEVEDGFLAQLLLDSPRHACGGENDDGCKVSLKNVKPRIDPTGVRNDNAQRISG